MARSSDSREGALASETTRSAVAWPCAESRSRPRLRSRTPAFTILLLILALSSGCGVDWPYIFHVAGGAIGSYSQLAPVDLVLALNTVTPEQADKLRFVQDVRAYAEHDVGLNVGLSYALYEDDGGDPIAWAVSASPKDRLAPYQWEFPIVGKIASKGYFDRALAQAEADRLKAEGYDTYLAAVVGFSTLGILPDPIRASNLRIDDIDLADFVFHELTHNTIYKWDDDNFDESLATFIGRTAARRFLQMRHADDPSFLDTVDHRFEDAMLIEEFVARQFETLDGYYAQAAAAEPPATPEQIVAGRDAVFDQIRTLYRDDYFPRFHDPDRYATADELSINNATVLANVRYLGGLDLYQQVFDRLNGNFHEFVPLLQSAAAAPNARQFLENWLAAP